MDDLKNRAVEEINSAKVFQELEKIRFKYLGRKGIVAEKFSKISGLPVKERKDFGNKINALKQYLTEIIEQKLSEIKQDVMSRDIAAGSIDITLPGAPFTFGKKHPLTRIMDEVKNIFMQLGFSVASGPDLEKDYYNFTALNVPPGHPARDVQDTFYVKQSDVPARQMAGGQCPCPIDGRRAISNTLTPDMLLRTHTSPVQIHVMEKQKPPVRIIAPGRVYRHEAVDASHSFIFHQIEGLAVDEDITFAELKSVLDIFIKKMFGSDVTSRFRPSYFPFTEPSAEVDMKCIICKGRGCGVCKQTGWVELLGCGMVNPAVFEFVGYDTQKYTGYAFGMGIERIAMLKYGIDDMRLFYENDMRFLKQF